MSCVRILPLVTSLPSHPVFRYTRTRGIVLAIDWIVLTVHLFVGGMLWRCFVRCLGPYIMLW